jgi:hypothetical protein
MEAGQWLEFFVNEQGYQPHEAQTPTTMPMYREWIKNGVTMEDFETAAIKAHFKLGGDRPGTPAYYLGFVKQVLIEKHRAQKSPISGLGESGFNLRNNTSRGSNYDRNSGNSNEIDRSSGRKLSAHERIQRDLRIADDLARAAGCSGDQGDVSILGEDDWSLWL